MAMLQGDDDSQNMASDSEAMTLQEVEPQTFVLEAPRLYVEVVRAGDPIDIPSPPSSNTTGLVIADNSNTMSSSSSVASSSTDNFLSTDELKIQLLSLLTLPSKRFVEDNDYDEKNKFNLLTKVNECLDKRMFLLRTYLEEEPSEIIKLLFDIHCHTLRNEIFVQDIDILRANIESINELTFLALQRKAHNLIKRLASKSYDSLHIIELLQSTLATSTCDDMLHLSNKVDEAQKFITKTNLHLMSAKMRVDENLINAFANLIIDQMIEFFRDEINNLIPLILINDHGVTYEIFTELMNISYKTKVIWNLIYIMLNGSGILPEFIHVTQGFADRFNARFTDIEAKIALTSLGRKVIQLLKINEISGKEGDALESRFANTMHWLTLLTPYEISQPLLNNAEELAEDVISKYEGMGENLKSHYVALIENEDYHEVFSQDKIMTMLGNLICYLQQQTTNDALSPNPYKKALNQAISGFDATVVRVRKGKQDTKLMMAVFEAYVQPIRSLLSSALHKHPLPRYDSLPLGGNRLGLSASPHRYSLPSTSSPVLFSSSSSDKPPALKVSVSASPSVLRRPNQVRSSFASTSPSPFFSRPTSSFQLLSLGFAGIEQWSLAMGQMMSGDLLSQSPPPRKG